MKKLLLAFISFILFLFSGVSQESKLAELEYLKNFKKELLTNVNTENRQIGKYDGTSSSGLKSTQDDYGDPPSWDWVNSFGGSGKDVARKVAVASDGSFYVTGSFSGEMSIGSNDYSSIGRRDAFLAKFQNDGSLIWFSQFSPSVGEKIDAYGIHTDGSGNVYFTGYYTGDVSFRNFDLTGNYGMNLFLAVANTNGEITMAVNHTTGNIDELGLKVDTDDDGNIFVLGSTDGTTYRYHPSVIIKYSADGTMLMDYYHDQNFCDMKIAGNNIYYNGTILLPDYIGDFYFEPSPFGSAFIAKSNTNMEFTWAEMAGHTSSGRSHGISIYISPSEEIFLSGSHDLNIIWSDFEITGTDCYIAKCSTDGEFSWVETISGESSDITGNNDYIFVCHDFNYQSNNPVFIHQITSFDMSSGVLYTIVN
ncbi:MAG: hypothetical protein K8R53_14385, partial [Bacteroidales bacterium]|nr:hypothetical protein [Bacteroidales bacterium]